MKASDFDRKFDNNESVATELDLSKIRRPAQRQQRVNVDFPSWMIESLDSEAKRLGGHPPIRNKGLDCRETRAESLIRDMATTLKALHSVEGGVTTIRT